MEFSNWLKVYTLEVNVYIQTVLQYFHHLNEIIWSIEGM